MTPLLPQGLVGGTSYDRLKGEARSRRFVRGVCFSSCVKQKGKINFQLVEKDSFKDHRRDAPLEGFIPEFINKV